MSRYAAGSVGGNSNLVTHAGTLVEGFGNTADWSSYGAQATGSAISNVAAQDTGMRFTSTAAGNVRYNKYTAGGINLSSVDTFSLWIKWDKLNTSSNLTIYMSSDAATVFANYVSITLTAAQGGCRTNGEACCLTWKRSDMSGAGTINWAAVTNLNLYFNMAAANEIPIVDSLYCGRRTRPKLVMCFDDGIEDANFSQITQAGVALSYGIPVSLMVIPRLVNGTGYLTTAQLKSLKAAGHLIAGHSDAGGGGDFAAAGYTATQVRADLQTTVDFLNNNGFSDGAQYYAWPGGKVESTDTTINYLPEATAVGIVCARSIIGVIQTNTNTEHINLGLLAPLSINAASIAAAPATLLGYVDTAISRGSSIFFYGHKISNGAATPVGYEITGNNFATFCSGVRDRIRAGLIDAVTMKEFYESYTSGHTRN